MGTCSTSKPGSARSVIRDRRGAVGAFELHGGAGDFADDLREVAIFDDDARLPGCLGGNGVVGGIGLLVQAQAELVAAELPFDLARGRDLGIGGCHHSPLRIQN